MSSFLQLGLVGVPNCGKTALFNNLTGSHQKVANYAGVTIEKKEGVLFLSQDHKIKVIDLPGTYSLRARSPDERVTRDAIFSSDPLLGFDVILCVADATNLHLGLRLVLELKKVGKPVILALNMMDIANKRRQKIDLQALSKELNIPVVPTVAVNKKGTKELKDYLDLHYPNFLNSEKKPSLWVEPNSSDIRQYHKEVQKILNFACEKPLRVSQKTLMIDKILLNPFLGSFLLLFVLFILFQSIFIFAKIPQDFIQSWFDQMQMYINAHFPQNLLKSLLVDGVFAGVGSVVVFLPQILTLFFFILILEDSGYMARAAVLMDRIMGVAGLHGKAFIPLLSSFACAIPGIMASRTIENKKERIITILIAPLMTCSARLPVYTLIIASFIPNKKIFGFFSLQGIVMFVLYAIGIVSGLVLAWILKKFFLKGTTEPLLLELPSYRIPNLSNIYYELTQRIKIFLTKAGTIILAVMVLLWFLSTFPLPPEHATQLPIHYSFAGKIGEFLSPIFAPIGFGWEIVIALILGFAAREVAIAALGTVYALSGSEDVVKSSLSHSLHNSWSLATACAFLTWYVFAPQCASTLAVTKRETNSWKWPIVLFTYSLVAAYAFSFLVYQVLSRVHL